MIVSVKTPAPAPAPVDLKLKSAADRFEAVFVREMLATMRKAKLADDIFGSGATDSFREMADAHMADAIARQGAFGIGNLVRTHLGAPK